MKNLAMKQMMGTFHSGKKKAKGWATGTLLVIGTSYLSEADLSGLQEEALV